ncbi:mCG119532, isoform CRA_c [Mus musculus]|nr:mCG119532, isoform CRA_c [Mus musculus]
MISETKEQSCTPTEDGLETYQKILIGVLVSFLLLFFLLLFLILIGYQCRHKNKATLTQRLPSMKNTCVRIRGPWGLYALNLSIRGNGSELKRSHSFWPRIDSVLLT